jgi:hypothetical protein
MKFLPFTGEDVGEGEIALPLNSLPPGEGESYSESCSFIIAFYKLQNTLPST